MSNGIDKPIYVYKRFRVKRADGGSTTVSVDPALVVHACKVLGSLSTVSRVVREAASKYDPSAPNAAKNRSAHVTRTLKNIVEGKAQVAEEVAEEVVTVAAAAENSAEGAQTEAPADVTSEAAPAEGVAAAVA